MDVSDWSDWMASEMVKVRAGGEDEVGVTWRLLLGGGVDGGALLTEEVREECVLEGRTRVGFGALSQMR